MLCREEASQEDLWKYSISLIRPYLDGDKLAAVGIDLPTDSAAESYHIGTAQYNTVKHEECIVYW